MTQASTALHTAEVVAELTEAEAVAFGAGLLGLPLLAFEMVHGVVEDHQRGVQLGAQVGFGDGFAFEIGERLGVDGPAPQTAAACEGAAVARQVWDSLEPAERATLLALPREALDAFAADLLLQMRQRTIGGR